MARAIQTADFAYQVENQSVLGETGFLCLIEMDRFNVDSDGQGESAQGGEGAGFKILPLADSAGVFPFHISLRKNENQIGIHPRYVVGRYEAAIQSTTCNVTQPKRFVEIPVLTIAQFNDIVVFNPTLGDDVEQPNSIINVNHTADGTGSLNYRIIKKVPERLV